ncbi:MAG: threonine/serine exporter family protein [Spirochaetaceae bacterium]|nr:threonine/serine exporter family protein [Spirochaetaceae bacterium]
MSVTDLLIGGICAFGGAFFYAIIFNSDKFDAIWSAALGTMAWTLYTVISVLSGSTAMGNLTGAFSVGVLAEVIAGLLKNPATVYVVPGLLPLLPGRDMYLTMRAAVEGDMNRLLSTGFQTLTTAAAIALAVAIASSAARITRSIIRRYGLWRRARF